MILSAFQELINMTTLDRIAKVRSCLAEFRSALTIVHVPAAPKLGSDTRGHAARTALLADTSYYAYRCYPATRS